MSKSRFAHLFSFAKAKAEDDEEKNNHQAIEDDEDKKDEELEEEEENKDSDADNSSDKNPEDEDEKAEDEESPEAKKARKAENKRCAAIFASPYAANNVAMAAQLAFETRLTAKEAVGVLASAPKQSKGLSLDDRMRSVKNPQIGLDAVATQDKSAAAQMMNIYNNVKGKK